MNKQLKPLEPYVLYQAPADPQAAQCIHDLIEHVTALEQEVEGLKSRLETARSKCVSLAMLHIQDGDEMRALAKEALLMLMSA